MKKQYIPIALLALLLLALIMRYGPSGTLGGKVPLKTDRWTGVTWAMYSDHEKPILDVSANAYNALVARKALSYAWVVLATGALVWLIKTSKEKEG